MKRFLGLLFFLFSFHISLVGQVNVQDSLALVALYESTDGDNWTNNENWLIGDVDTWFGVFVENDRVTGIQLQNENIEYTCCGGNNLIGKIPPEIGDLSELRFLRLAYNALSNPLPVELSLLSKLEELSLSDNLFEGEIPAFFGEQESLYVLHLNSNSFSGEIPKELHQLGLLFELHLSNNELSGIIPPELGQLINLKEFFIDGNQLTGSIPIELGDMLSLQRLDVSDNALSGKLPEELSNLQSIREIKLSENDFIGVIPLSLTGLNNLGLDQWGWVFDYSSTLLCEPDDPIWEQWKSGRTIVGTGSTCSGTDFFSYSILGFDELPLIDRNNHIIRLNLSDIDLNDLVAIFEVSSEAAVSVNGIAQSSGITANDFTNPVTYTISNEFGSESQEWQIVITNESLVGGVVESEYNALTAFYNSTNGDNWDNNFNWLSNNPVEDWFGVNVENNRIVKIKLASNIEFNCCRGNNLTGTLPDEIGDLLGLKSLDLERNDITGDIPNTIGKLLDLQVLNMPQNQFSGSIPEEMTELVNLEFLQLRENEFTGSIPVGFLNMPSLEYLSLGSNNLSGTVPSEIGDNSILHGLAIQGNNLTGTIPSSIGNLTNLSTLYLHDNQLRGNIPIELGNLTRLSDLGLRNNQLSGSLPGELGNLTNIYEMFVDNNPLSGSIPLSFVQMRRLGGVDWATFNYSNTDICEPQDQAYQDWKQGRNIIGTGLICEEESYSLYTDSLALVTLYESTDGDNWTDNANWLSGDVVTWFGVGLQDGRINLINLGDNNLNGEIPEEVTGLSELQFLNLHGNSLIGKLPSSINQLSKLSLLFVSLNLLEGEIPIVITELNLLEDFEFFETSLCESQDQVYQDWKEGRNIIDNGIICSSDAEIFTFSIEGQVGETIVDTENAEINFTMPFGSDLTGIVADFTVSDGASVKTCGETTVSLPASKDTQVWSYRPTVAMANGVGQEIAIYEWTKNGIPTTKYGMFDFDFSSIPANADITSAKLSLYHTFSVDDPNQSQLSGSNEGVIQRITSEWTELVTWGTKPQLTTENQVILPASTSEDQDYPDIDVTNIVQDMITEPENSHGFNIRIQTEQYYRSLMFASKDHPNSELHPHLDIRYSLGSGTDVASGVTALDYTEPVCLIATSSDQQISKQWTINVEFGPEEYSLYTDSLALVALYASTDGDNWTNNTNWLTGDIDTWHGVTLNGDFRVSNLYLVENNLSGILPSEMGDLDQLRSINFGINNLTGEMPTEMSSLSKLEFLDMFANQMTGDIPAYLGQFTGLTTLHLSDNQFSGTISPELGNLQNLSRLALVNNALTGSIPEELGSLTNLKFLELHTNQLTGSIPSCLGNLAKLELLHLAYNQIDGSLPRDLSNLSSIKEIDLGLNQLSGPIPDWIGQLTSLQNLILNRNNFSGSIPAEFGNLVNLDYFSLTKNNLTGELPPEIGDMTNLRVFDIEDNQLSGELPESLANLSRLERVYIFRNQLEGTVPKSFLELDLLTELSIFDNFIDSLPDVSLTKPDLQVVAHTNNLTFADLEPNMTLFEFPYYYIPQRSFGIEQTISVELGENVSMSQSPVGGTANSYQWYKDDEPIDGAIDETYEVPNPSPESEGAYTLKVTNSKVPGLTLTSHPIELIYELRTENKIVTYSIPGEFAPADVDQTNMSISVYLPCDAPDIAIPSFELSGGALAFINDERQESGVSTIDLSSNLSYRIVAEDGSESVWTITVANPNPIEIFSTIEHLSSCNTTNGSIRLDSLRLDSDEIVRLPNNRFNTVWSTTATVSSIDVTSEGTYTVEVMDNETGCSYTRSFEVLTKDLEGALSLREKKNNTSCGVANGLLSVDANIGSSQGLDYAWYKGTTASGSIIERTKRIDSLEAGSYTLVVTDLDTDCTVSLTETIEKAQQSVDFTLTSSQNTSCLEPNGTIAVAELTINGDETTSTLGYRIEWSTTEDFAEVMEQTREVRELAAGTYYARLIGVNTDCISPVRSVAVVHDRQELSFDMSITPNSRCDEQGNGSATLIGLPEQAQIQWYQGTAVIQGQSSSTISALSTGSYQVEITDQATGCSTTRAFEIKTTTPEMAVEVTASDNTSCAMPNGSAAVTAVSVNGVKATNLDAFSFEWWLADDEAKLIQGKSINLEEMGGGEYYVQVTLDSMGCQSTPVATTINEETHDFSVALVSSRPDLPETSGTGQLEIEIVNAPETASISWYEGESTSGFIVGETLRLDNINAGKYTVEVTDTATGCDQVATYEVDVDERLAQTISFVLPEIINVAELPLTLVASSDQGLPIRFEVIEGVGEINENQLTTTTDGFITIRAYNEGTDEVAYGEAIKPIRVVSDFYLEGVVTGATDGVQVSGEVVIFTLDGAVFASAPFTNGQYFIDGLPAGKYRILIEVTGEFNAVAFDTYYLRKLLWNRATIITLNDNTQVDVELLPKTLTPMNGQGTISGKVVQSDGGSRIVVGRTLEGTPLEDIKVYLHSRDDDNVVAEAITNEEGIFTFENVPTGQYYFRIDAVGYDIADLGADIDYDESEGILEISAAIGTEGLEVDYAVVSGTEDDILKDISIYPNPAQNTLHIQDAQNRIKSVQLMNLTGQLTRTFETNRTGQYDISTMTGGMYLIRIDLEDEQFVHSKVMIRE